MAGDGDAASPAPVDPRDLRVSDAEREHVAGLLHKAVGHGLISLTEFEERTDKALAAQTRGALNGVLADLPFMRNEQVSSVVAEQPLVLRTGTGTLRQNGYWTVPRDITAVCGMGNISIDFTRARCPHREVTLRAKCGTGNVTAIVPRGWQVVMMEAISHMGSVVNKATDPPVAGMPVLRVYGEAGLGHVRIRHPRGREQGH